MLQMVSTFEQPGSHLPAATCFVAGPVQNAIASAHPSDYASSTLLVCSTASSHSHDSPAPSHVSNQLFNILDEPLAETAAAPLQNAPPSAGWDAFAAPVAASGPSPPDSITWSAFDNGGPAVAPPHLTTHQLPPQQHQAQSQQQVQQQPSQQRSQVTAPYHQQQQQQSQADMATAWAAFGDSSSQAVPNQQPSQTQEVSPQQQQQQQQQRREEPVAAQPPKPAPRQELPLVSTVLLLYMFVLVPLHCHSKHYCCIRCLSLHDRALHICGNTGLVWRGSAELICAPCQHVRAAKEPAWGVPATPGPGWPPIWSAAGLWAGFCQLPTGTAS